MQRRSDGQAMTPRKAANVTQSAASAATGSEPKPQPQTGNKGAAVGGVRALAHELRTPLGAIVTLAEVLGQAPDDALGHTAYRQYVADIRDSAIHALAVMDAALAGGMSAQSEAVADSVSEASADAAVEGAGIGAVSDWPAALGPVDLNAIAQQMASAMGPLAEAGGVTLICDVGCAPAVCQTSARAVRQILFNLLANCLRFTPAGGTVRITVETLPGAAAAAASLSADQTLPQVALTVSDTGVGLGGPGAGGGLIASVPQMILGGTGLGLKIVEALAVAARCEVTYDSDMGAGTRVTLMFAGHPGERSGDRPAPAPGGASVSS